MILQQEKGLVQGIILAAPELYSIWLAQYLKNEIKKRILIPFVGQHCPNSTQDLLPLIVPMPFTHL